MKIFGQHVHQLIFFLASAEFCLTGAAFLVSAAVFPLDQSVPATADLTEDARALSYALPAIGFAAVVALGLTAMGLYQVKQRLGLPAVLVRVLLGLALAAVLLALLDFVFPLGIEGPLWTSSFVLSVPLLAIGRIGFSRIADQEIFRRRVLVYGAGQRAGSILGLRRRSDQRGFRLVGFIPAPGDKFVLHDDRIVQMKGALLEYAAEHGVNEIVVAMDDRRRGFPIKELLDCKLAGIPVVDLLSFLERETGRLRIDLVNPAYLIFSEGFASGNIYRLSKRAIDFVLSLLALIVASPLMAAVAIAIVLEDGRPILYRQRRVGLNREEYVLYKFRSMSRDAESEGPKWAEAGDSRVTRVGRFIRKMRFDELPQFINVLRGEMSIVGPRPERPEFVEGFSQKIPYYHERHCVKPGITGWAQLCYPYGSSEQDAVEKLQFDLYYVKHQSSIFDLVVMIQTLEVVLWGKGAR